jgi:hypothetical protein
MRVETGDRAQQCLLSAIKRKLASDNHGALTICLHAGGKPASVSGGFGLGGGGCSVDSLNQKSSSRPQPSLGRGGDCGLHSALPAGQAIWT